MVDFIHQLVNAFFTIIIEKSFSEILRYNCFDKLYIHGQKFVSLILEQFLFFANLYKTKVIHLYCSNLVKSFSTVMHVLAVEKANEWLYLIPLYHIFAKSMGTRGANCRSPEWWGTAGFDDDVQGLKKAYSR